VPTYQYACKDCGHAFEQVQTFTEDSLTVCPVCQGSLRKVFNAVGVVFKGSGFYRNDSRSGSGEKSGDKASSSEKSGSGEKSGGSEKSGSGEKKSGDSGSASSTTASSSSGSGSSSSSSSSSGSSSSGSSTSKGS